MIVSASGMNIVLRCSSKGRQIKWTKDNTPLPSNHRHKILSNGTLVINDANKNDAGSYTCTKDVSASGKNTFHVRIVESPRVTPFEFPRDIMVGSRTKVMCSISRGDPPIKFQWLKDGVEIVKSGNNDNNGLRVESNEDYTILSIESVSMSHAGNYTCQVTNEASRSSHTSLLHVNQPPKWISEPFDQSTISGSDITIDCNAIGNPQPSITWKKAIGKHTLLFPTHRLPCCLLVSSLSPSSLVNPLRFSCLLPQRLPPFFASAFNIFLLLPCLFLLLLIPASLEVPVVSSSDCKLDSQYLLPGLLCLCFQDVSQRLFFFSAVFLPQKPGSQSEKFRSEFHSLASFFPFWKIILLLPSRQDQERQHLPCSTGQTASVPPHPLKSHTHLLLPPETLLVRCFHSLSSCSPSLPPHCLFLQNPWKEQGKQVYK